LYGIKDKTLFPDGSQPFTRIMNVDTSSIVDAVETLAGKNAIPLSAPSTRRAAMSRRSLFGCCCRLTHSDYGGDSKLAIQGKGEEEYKVCGLLFP